jgi:GDPmannose 4,6-dehydratase
LKTAIITGVSGQDGAYLSELLLNKGYRVIGLVRSVNNATTQKLSYLNIADRVELYECDLQDLSHVINVLQQYKPSEIYNLAAQSSVSLSFEQPIGTLQFNINSVLNILEAIRLIDNSIKFYQASSSEMFGKVAQLPISENTIFHPLSPYAISKVAAHHISINYRESYNIYACCGVLFNHESYLRGNNFLVKKLLKGALDIKYGKIEHLEFGNLDIKRDFGFSKDYVNAMWLMMQLEKPTDFLICSGQSIQLRKIVEYVFDYLKISKDKIVINKKFYRPTEIEDIYGSNEKAKRELNWNAEFDFFKVLNILIEEEERNYVG